MTDVRPAYALLLLGSNIDPEQHIEAAIVQLRACADLMSLSPIYQTPAVSAPETADYHNQAVILRDPLTFEELRSQLKRIETASDESEASIPMLPGRSISTSWPAQTTPSR